LIPEYFRDKKSQSGDPVSVAMNIPRLEVTQYRISFLLVPIKP
jgi:hypothetical protein